MKISIAASILAASAALAPSLAHADDAAVSASSESTVWAGGTLELLPVGSLKASANGSQELSNDTATAFAVGGVVDYRVNPFFSIGLAPRFIFNVKGTNANDSANQLDLRLRATLGTEVAPKTRIYGFATPGYSWILPPSDSMGNTVHPNGFIVGAGVGASYEIAPKVALTGELGYQLGFQGYTAKDATGKDVDVSLKDNFLQLGVGISAALD